MTKEERKTLIDIIAALQSGQCRKKLVSRLESMVRRSDGKNDFRPERHQPPKTIGPLAFFAGIFISTLLLVAFSVTAIRAFRHPRPLFSECAPEIVAPALFTPNVTFQITPDLPAATFILYLPSPTQKRPAVERGVFENGGSWEIGTPH